MTFVRPLSALLRLGTGPIVWFVHFTLTYGAEVVVCRPRPPAPDAMPWFGATTTLLALTVLAWFAIASLRRDPAREGTDAAFLRSAALLLSALAALGVIWTAIPITLLRACG